MNFLMSFTSIGGSKTHLHCMVEYGVKIYSVSPRHVAYALQESFKKELERLQELQIIVPLGLDKTAEWYNSFVLVP